MPQGAPCLVKPRKRFIIPCDTSVQAADRKSVDIIRRAGCPYIKIGDAGKQGDTTAPSVVQKKLKVVKPTEKGAYKSRTAIDGAWRPPTEKGAYKSRTAIDGAWRPPGNPSCRPTIVGTDSSSNLVINPGRGATTRSKYTLRRWTEVTERKEMKQIMLVKVDTGTMPADFLA